MIQEVLLSLLGNCGDKIVEKVVVVPGNDTNKEQHEEVQGFELLPDCEPSLHPAEREQINQLCHLGFIYSKLQGFVNDHRFLLPAFHASKFVDQRKALNNVQKNQQEQQQRQKIQQESQQSSLHQKASRKSIERVSDSRFKKKGTELSQGTNNNSNQDNIKPSMYKRAIFMAISDILDAYENDLVKLEHKLLDDHILPLVHLKHALNDYMILFPYLFKIARTIETDGSQDVNTKFRSGLRGGELLDYIHRKSFHGVTMIRLAMEKILFHCNAVLIRHITSWVVYGILSDPFDEFFISEQGTQIRGETQNAWSVQYVLRTSMLPNYISLRLANKILFIGKAVQVLKREYCNSKNDSDNHKKQRDILESELDKFAQAFRVHEKSQVLHILSFEYTIDKIRDVVGKHLWKLISVQYNLMNYLVNFKNYFLLSKGDFFQCFIEDSQFIMQSLPTKNAARDIQDIFQKSASKLGIEEDVFFQNLSVKFCNSDISSKFKPISSNTENNNQVNTDVIKMIIQSWNGLELGYHVQWPLHLLFHDEIIEKYNRLFRFLLLVKRVQCELQKAWPLLMELKTLRFGKHPKILTRLWQLRSRMAFLIDNLQFYLHVDVIEVQFAKLKDVIQNMVSDFEHARKSHDHFLGTLISQCFLNVKQIGNSLDKIFEQCFKLCDLIKEVSQKIKEETENDQNTSKSPDTIIGEQIKDEIEMTEVSFDMQSKFLFRILTGIPVLSPHLQQLLLRIDFNKYFSSSL